MRRRLIMGIVLVVVPLLAIGGVVFYFYHLGHSYPKATASLIHPPENMRAFGLTIDHPPPNFFDRNSQLMVGFGLCIASICWGAGKIIGALKGGRDA